MNPITRKEMFLAAAGGQDVTTPTPVTREEVFLDAIAKGGGGGGGSSGGGVLVVNMNAGTLDKTWEEISDAISEKPVIILFAMGYTTTILYVVSVQKASRSGEKYYVTAFSPIEDYASSIVTFAANTSGDYPAIQS